MKTTTLSRRLAVPIALAAIMLFTGIILLPFSNEAESGNLPEEIQELILEHPVPVRPFSLLDQENKPFTVDRLKGNWTLMFFGYTHCPDVCPTTLAEVDNAASRLDKIPQGKNKLQYVFVSIDPGRDNPRQLGEYVGYFGAKFIAVTGDHKQLKQLANPLGIKYKIGTGFNNEYLVEHSSAMLLIDPEGRSYARFKAPHYSEEIVAGFKALKKYYGETD